MTFRNGDGDVCAPRYHIRDHKNCRVRLNKTLCVAPPRPDMPSDANGSRVRLRALRRENEELRRALKETRTVTVAVLVHRGEQHVVSVCDASEQGVARMDAVVKRLQAITRDAAPDTTSWIVQEGVVLNEMHAMLEASVVVSA